jgi:LCP family protein required for cell wall assembly
MTDRPRPRHPALAALLSFLFPGLGQAYAGQTLLAVLLAAPVALLVIAAILAATLFAEQVRNDLFSSTFLSTALLLDVALLFWRLVAIAHAGLWRGAPVPVAVGAAERSADVAEHHAAADAARRAGGIGLVILLLVATVAMHAWAGIVIGRLNTTLADVFSGGQGPTGGGGAGPRAPLNEPTYAWDGTDRINFLLLGVDAAPGRGHSLSDTILAVSIDPVADTAVMISVPRDTGFLPLPDTRIYADGLYPRKINELATQASLDPALWCPDLPVEAAAACGVRTLERSVGLYLGIPIQYYAQVDLEGFTRMIDAVGGLNLCLPGRMVDPQYTAPGWEGRGAELEAGCRAYDGDHALAFARIRKGWIELPDGTLDYQNDFKRADRQQQVLLALRGEFAEADLILELPGLLEAVGSTVSTDFPRTMAGDLASLLPLITGTDIEREVLGYPDYVDAPTDPELNYMLLPRRDDVRAGMQALFGPTVVLDGWYLGTDEPLPPSAPAPPY